MPREKTGKYEIREQVTVVEEGLEEEPMRELLLQVRTPYLAIIREGESYCGDSLEQLGRCLDGAAGRADAAVPGHPNRKFPWKKQREAKGKLLSLEDERELMLAPGCLDGAVLCTEAVRRAVEAAGAEGSAAQDRADCFGWKPDLRTRLAYRVLREKPVLAYVETAGFLSASPFVDGGGYRKEWTQPEWYLGVVEGLRGRLSGEPSLFVQAQAVYAMKLQFQENLNVLDKGALGGELFDRYYRCCLDCLRHIRPSLIFPEGKGNRERQMVPALRSVFAWMKDEADGGAQKLPGLPVTMQLMEFAKGRSGDGVLRMDFETEAFLPERGRLRAVLGERELELYSSPRFCAVKAFGVPFRRYAFSLELNPGQLRRDNRLEFFFGQEGDEVRLPILSVMYQTRISSFVDHSYWCFGPYMVTFFGKGAERDGIRIRRAGRLRRMAQECRVLAAMPFGENRSRKMFVQRVRYWLAWPSYRKKRIWLTFDKLYKGGDCGEYFYRYLVQRGDPAITPAYVIQGKAKDAKRLREEGFDPLAYGSQRQKLSFLYASMIFATHSSVHAFNGFNAWEIQFLQDRLRAVNTCIQHGLSVQNLTADSNRVVNNNKRYYCASKYEVENLLRPEYDYPGDVLRLTGIPRFDGLENRDRRQLLITPTWRSYLAMPSVPGSARPYNPQFKESEYFRVYEGLLSDERLAETARRTGYRILYLLHPVISAQKEDFTKREGIEIVSALETDYETVLAESSLMVTDYSGVQFDFAYLRKPVVYFHPKALPPHHEGGIFDYQEQGFGEICEEKDSLVALLCAYMERGCRIDPFYKAREDRFFAFDDRESCRRIYEDAKELQDRMGDAGCFI